MGAYPIDDPYYLTRADVRVLCHGRKSSTSSLALGLCTGFPQLSVVLVTILIDFL
jgi:hypothetical protein